MTWRIASLFCTRQDIIIHFLVTGCCHKGKTHWSLVGHWRNKVQQNGHCFTRGTRKVAHSGAIAVHYAAMFHGIAFLSWVQWRGCRSIEGMAEVQPGPSITHGSTGQVGAHSIYFMGNRNGLCLATLVPCPSLPSPVLDSHAELAHMDWIQILLSRRNKGHRAALAYMSRSYACE